MKLFSDIFYGFIFGLVLMLVWTISMIMRSNKRIFKVISLCTLAHLTQAKVKRLCGSDYPLWVSFPTFERVKWLNKMLDRIWPSVALAASQILRESLEPLLALYAPPGYKMSISQLFLGNVAPQIEGIKIQTVNKGQLIMDLDFKWGGDPSIILAIGTSIGANLPVVKLENLRFFATVRVILKFAEDLPCIAAVVVALLAKPKPEIRYEVLVIGGNISNLLGISEIIKGIVENAVTGSLQWPQRIVIPIGYPHVDLSDLELKLQGRLTVTIVKAETLKNMETFTISDPYVEAYVRILFKNRTKTIDCNLNPVWNETFIFDIEDQETQSLILKVFDEDIVGAHKLLGAFVYPLVKLIPEETRELTLPLTPCLEMDNVIDLHDRGTLTIQIQYHVYTKDEQEAAMEKEREFLRKKAADAREGLIGSTMDVIGGAVGGAGKLVAGGVGVVGSSVGRVGSSISRAARGVSSSFIARSSFNSVQQIGPGSNP